MPSVGSLFLDVEIDADKAIAQARAIGSQVSQKPIELQLKAHDDATRVIDQARSAGERFGNLEAEARITSRDDATQAIQAATSTLERFDGMEGEAALRARDDATSVLVNATEALRRFDQQDAEALISARDDASRIILAADRALEEIDGQEAQAVIRARDDASRILNQIDSELDEIEGRNVSATLRARDDASSEINRVSSQLKEIDGRTATAVVKADTAQASASILAFGGDIQNKLLGFFAVDAAITGFQRLISASSNLEQSIGGTEAVFKTFKADIDGFATTSAENFGLAESAFRDFATLIGSQLKNAGVPMEELADKTVELISLGSDLAATYGGTVADAVGAISATLRGEFDTIERYGVALTAAEVEARAMADGFVNADGKVTAFGKKMSVLAIISEQTADAQGQFNREAETTAGKVQRATAGLENLAAKMGDSLVPIFLEGVEVVTSFAEALEALKVPELLQMGTGDFELPGILENIRDFEIPGLEGLSNPFSFMLNPLTETKELFGAVTDGANAFFEAIGLGADKAAPPLQFLGIDIVKLNQLISESPFEVMTRLANEILVTADAARSAHISLIPVASVMDDIAQARSIPFTAAMEDFAVAVRENAANAVERFNNALGSIDWRQADVDGATTAFAGFRSELLSLTDIAVDRRDAVQGFRDVIADFNFEDLAQNSRASVDALSALGTVVDTELAAAFASAGGDITAFGASAEGTFQRLVADLGLGTAEADVLREALGLMPEDIQTRFELAGDEAAQIRLGLMQSAIDLLPEEIRVAIGELVGAGDFQGALDLAQTSLTDLDNTVAQPTVLPIVDMVALEGVAGAIGSVAYAEWLATIQTTEFGANEVAFPQIQGVAQTFYPATITTGEFGAGEIAYPQIQGVAQTFYPAEITTDEFGATEVAYPQIQGVAQTFYPAEVTTFEYGANEVARPAIQGVADDFYEATIYGRGDASDADNEFRSLGPYSIPIAGYVSSITGVPKSISVPMTLTGPRAQGGIFYGAAQAFDQGGMRAASGRLPTSARIQRGQLVQWAEPETGGEAFIPLALSKRKRSSRIWAETGRLLGLLSSAEAKAMRFEDGGFRSPGAADRVATAAGAVTLTQNYYTKDPTVSQVAAIFAVARREAMRG